MHYFIFPTKDSSIFNDSVTKNIGLDQILEIRKTMLDNTTQELSRTLIQFDTTEISTLISENSITGSIKYYLNLVIADANEIKREYTIHAHPLLASWSQGSGKETHIPITTDGVSWKYRTVDVAWSGSVSASAGGYYSSSIVASQSFSDQSADIVMDVTNIVNHWLSGSLTNYGFILKFPSANETDTTDYGTFRYYSSKTHTIYRPRLEIVWNDSVWRTYALSSSISSSNTITTSSYMVSQSIGFTTSSTYIGPTVWSSSYSGSNYIQIGTSSLWVSESYGQFKLYQTFSYLTASGVYRSSSVEYASASYVYTSGSNSIISKSLSGGTIVYTYTGSLGTEFTQSATNVWKWFQTTQSSYFIQDSNGVYRSESYTELFRIDTYISQSISSSTSIVTTATHSLYPIGSETMIVAVKGLQSEYKQGSKIRIRLVPRERFPRKTYSTSWRYSSNYILPRSSSYAIKDSTTEYEVVPFSDYTNISCDPTGSFFDLWTNGYEPERYYKILLKVYQNGREFIYDNNYTFKLVR